MALLLSGGQATSYNGMALLLSGGQATSYSGNGLSTTWKNGEEELLLAARNIRHF